MTVFPFFVSDAFVFTASLTSFSLKSDRELCRTPYRHVSKLSQVRHYESSAPYLDAVLGAQIQGLLETLLSAQQATYNAYIPKDKVAIEVEALVQMHHTGRAGCYFANLLKLDSDTVCRLADKDDQTMTSSECYSIVNTLLRISKKDSGCSDGTPLDP